MTIIDWTCIGLGVLFGIGVLTIIDGGGGWKAWAAIIGSILSMVYITVFLH